MKGTKDDEDRTPQRLGTMLPRTPLPGILGTVSPLLPNVQNKFLQNAQHKPSQNYSIQDPPSPPKKKHDT